MDPATAKRWQNLLDARNSFVMAFRSKRKAKERHKTGFHHSDRNVPQRLRNAGYEWTVLFLPESIYLDTNYVETVGFIRELRSLVADYTKLTQDYRF